MQFINPRKGATIEALVYPLLLIAVLWALFLLDRYLNLNLYQWGVLPKTFKGIKGILFMPFIHGQKDFSHIINNSIPLFILMSSVIYFYRDIAFKVIAFTWLIGGFLLWLLAVNTGAYHIGISGVIYGLFGFLFISGFFRSYLPLQAISLVVVFLYGSLVWGVFPTQEAISWEGHLFGFFVGSICAVVYRKEGPVAPKYRYEIEKELGIPPPDLEGEWLERRRQWLLQQERLEEQLKEKAEAITKAANQSNVASQSSTLGNVQVQYEWKKEGVNPPKPSAQNDAPK